MGARILVVRMGAMGDVVHALPAVASLKHSFPHSHLAWIIDPRWAPLIEGNPFVDSAIELDRRSLSSLRSAWRSLRAEKFDLAVDFQGLLKSALAASAGRAPRIIGFHRSQLREPIAALFYSKTHRVSAAHVVDRNLELAAAAGASNLLRVFPLPPGVEEDDLPSGDFVLACPFAGWPGKQWPIEYYSELARLVESGCGMQLVLNGPAASRDALAGVRGARTHISGLRGLLRAIRMARAVVGPDSGPMHLAAALDKPGVAIYGPTDPARNGPYGDAIKVLRDARASTSYKRASAVDASMRAISPQAVLEALQAGIERRSRSADCRV